MQSILDKNSSDFDTLYREPKDGIIAIKRNGGIEY
jgi:hypothetical protein